jgi:hypothetical protein
LLPREASFNHHDIVAYMFEVKQKASMNDILQEHFLEEVKSHVMLVKYQNTILPHVHVLFVFQVKITYLEPIDNIICANSSQEE